MDYHFIDLQTGKTFVVNYYLAVYTGLKDPIFVNIHKDEFNEILSAFSDNYRLFDESCKYDSDSWVYTDYYYFDSSDNKVFIGKKVSHLMKG